MKHCKQAPLFPGIDFPDAFDGLSDGLVGALEDNDFPECMLPLLFDGPSSQYITNNQPNKRTHIPSPSYLNLGSATGINTLWLRPFPRDLPTHDQSWNHSNHSSRTPSGLARSRSWSRPADRRTAASPPGQQQQQPQRAATTTAASSSSSSLLLQVFNGAMRPQVAALAAAAAQRALVTSSSVPPGLYFSEPEPQQQQQGADVGRGGGAAAAAAGAPGKGAKRGGKDKDKDKQGMAAGGSVPAPTALPLAKYYPEADAELVAALYGKRPLPRRLRVEAITDRCHPCFRNPFEGLAAVKERKKLVATGGAPARDSLVVVGDPSTCLLAEANAPRFWGSCAGVTKPGSLGEGDRAACNCRAYKGRVDNAAVIPCLIKVRLSRLMRASTEAACGDGGGGGGGGMPEDLAKGFQVLRAAAAAAAAGAAAQDSAGGVVMTTTAAAAAGGGGAASGSTGAHCGGGSRTAGTVTVAATGNNAVDDPDKSTYVYGIVTVVVTSNALKEGEEILLRWDSDDSFFAVADQNLRQYLYIRDLAAERDAAEAKAVHHQRLLALLRKSHRECQSSREAALHRGDALFKQKEEMACSLEEAVRQRDEAVRQRDEAVRQRDEAIEDVKNQRAASAAVAAAAGPRVSRLEAQVAQLQAERDALSARLERFMQQQDRQHRGQQRQELLQQQSSASQLQQQQLQGQRQAERHEQHHQHHQHHQQEQQWRQQGQTFGGNGKDYDSTDGDEEHAMAASVSAGLLQRYEDAKRQYDAAAAAMVSELVRLEAVQRRRTAQLAAARREAEEAAARLSALQRDVETSR
ncbi:hypothetical protein VOLCADRAFT_91638 [Volvox carteri f. nagariensis]|uniref:SET domain-containing protein n=1 Tax=Volvox carteri f. nagariensis TaxID=3068 RepID=D8TXL5_VOLCA|nr:uncharacterized protein VOLCADRAFT_91638 [Volvox carteri f. nagariensis]EFJ47745.1 hypothetical protein VOLCADRAFT_91638 [Volvox carteri f. nagariensis]|eukprot:XP_002951216.1 hypothetical protein VOLCADRAFT_91638 [Volvox carteri f. nagariensis]